jgi:hypothetical protein
MAINKPIDKPKINPAIILNLLSVLSNRDPYRNYLFVTFVATLIFSVHQRPWVIPKAFVGIVANAALFILHSFPPIHLRNKLTQ